MAGTFVVFALCWLFVESSQILYDGDLVNGPDIKDYVISVEIAAYIKVAPDARLFFVYDTHFSDDATGEFYIGAIYNRGTLDLRFSKFGSYGQNLLPTQCADGADFGRGLTCSLNGVPYKLGTLFYLKIEQLADEEKSFLVGSVRVQDGTSYTIGIWSPPGNYTSGNIAGAGVLFFEHFASNSCADREPYEIGVAHVSGSGLRSGPAGMAYDAAPYTSGCSLAGLSSDEVVCGPDRDPRCPGDGVMGYYQYYTFSGGGNGYLSRKDRRRRDRFLKYHHLRHDWSGQ